MIKLSIVVLFSLDTVNLAFDIPDNICGQFRMRFYTKHLYIRFFLTYCLLGNVEKLVVMKFKTSLNIFQDIITQKFCNLVGHLKDLEGGYNRILEVTSMFALTVKGVQKRLPSLPLSGPLLVIVVLQFSVYGLVKFN